MSGATSENASQQSNITISITLLFYIVHVQSTVLVKLTCDPNNSRYTLRDQRDFFNSRSPPNIYIFSLIIRDSQVPSCSRLAPFPAPVHYVIGHQVRVREHCSRLSCIQSGLPTGRLDVFPDRDRPSRTSDRGRGDGTCPAGSGASIDARVFSFSTSGSTTSSSLSIQIAAGLARTYTYVYVHVRAE